MGCSFFGGGFFAGFLMRCGCVKISKPSLRAIATSVMPAASAVRTASAVGAETATISGAPMTAVFCTISTDTRLVSNTMPFSRDTAPRSSAPRELVERVVAADVLAHRDETRIRAPECRSVHRARLPVELLAWAQRIERPHDLGRRKGRAVRHARQRAHGFLEAFDAAQPAAGRAGEMPPPLAERGGARLGQPHAQLDAGIVFDDLELSDVG